MPVVYLLFRMGDIYAANNHNPLVIFIFRLCLVFGEKVQTSVTCCSNYRNVWPDFRRLCLLFAGRDASVLTELIIRVILYPREKREGIEMEKKHHVKLNDEERAHIEKMMNVAKTPKTLKKRCQVLLLADEVAGKPPSYEEIAARCGVSDVTVWKTARDYCQQGIEVCLRYRSHKEPPRKPIVTGEKEARIVALACGEPPEGYARWSVRLLRDKVVELQIVDAIGRETIRSTLKKRNLSLT